MAKSTKEKPVSGKLSVIYFYKDYEHGGEYAHAFGSQLYEIDADIFHKHAILKDKAQPDILEIFCNNIIRLARKALDV